MNTYCPCGGLFVRSDTYTTIDPVTKRELVADSDPLVAHWKCNKCGSERQQRKRQSRLQEDEEIDNIMEDLEKVVRRMKEALKRRR